MLTKPMPFHPQGFYIMLAEVKESDRTEGGIWIPDQHRNLLNQGTVLEIGPDAKTQIYEEEKLHIVSLRRTLAVGDMVVFPMHQEHRIQFDNKWFIVILYSEVMLADHGYFMELQELKDALPKHPEEAPVKEERRKPLGLDAMRDIQNSHPLRPYDESRG